MGYFDCWLKVGVPMWTEFCIQRKVRSAVLNWQQPVIFTSEGCCLTHAEWQGRFQPVKLAGDHAVQLQFHSQIILSNSTAYRHFGWLSRNYLTWSRTQHDSLFPVGPRKASGTWQIQQTCKGNVWCCGMKMQIVVDYKANVVYLVATSSDNMREFRMINESFHRNETRISDDSE